MLEEGGSQEPWKEARGEKMLTNHNGEEDRSGVWESLRSIKCLLNCLKRDLHLMSGVQSTTQGIWRGKEH